MNFLHHIFPDRQSFSGQLLHSCCKITLFVLCLQSAVSFLPGPSLVLRTIIDVFLDILVFDVAFESISVEMETCRYDYLDFWFVWMRLLLACIFVVIQIQSGLLWRKIWLPGQLLFWLDMSLEAVCKGSSGTFCSQSSIWRSWGSWRKEVSGQPLYGETWKQIAKLLKG